MKQNDVIIVLSTTTWNFGCDYLKQISLRLAKHYRIGVANPIQLPTIRQILFKHRGYRKAKTPDNITHLYSMGILPLQRFEFIYKINQRINVILLYLQIYGKFGVCKPNFWIFQYDFADIVPHLFPRNKIIYDRPDQFSSLDPINNQIITQKDKRLIRLADHIFTNSPYAYTYIRKLNKNVAQTPWGYNPNLFKQNKKYDVPPGLKKICHPIIGFIGNVDHRLNLKLLSRLARDNQRLSFVVIGPVNEFSPKDGQIVDFKRQLSEIKKLRNVHFLGYKDKGQISQYLHCFDVCINPYDISQEFVLGCNPMKIYEYLGAGKPVVSTPIPAILKYRKHIKIANTAIGFKIAITNILKKTNAKQAKEYVKIANENSWDKKVKLMVTQLRRTDS